MPTGYQGQMESLCRMIAAEGKFMALLHGANANAGTPGTHGPILLCAGAVVPADGQAGFAVGCAFYLLNQANGAVAGIYVNEGTAESCDLNLVSE